MSYVEMGLIAVGVIGVIVIAWAAYAYGHQAGHVEGFNKGLVEGEKKAAAPGRNGGKGVHGSGEPDDVRVVGAETVASGVIPTRAIDLSDLPMGYYSTTGAVKEPGTNTFIAVLVNAGKESVYRLTQRPYTPGFAIDHLKQVLPSSRIAPRSPASEPDTPPLRAVDDSEAVAAPRKSA